MSSSDPRAFVADLFDAEAPPAPADRAASPWALEELGDDLFGGVQATGPLAAGFAMPGDAPHAHTAPAIDAEELARREADAFARGRAEGYAAGEAAGKARGHADALATLAAPQAALRAAVEQLTAAEQRWLALLAENVCALAVGVARHVLDRELTTDPSLVATLAQRAIDEFPLDQALVLRLHPDDVAAVQAALPPAALGTRELRLAADAHVARGGCLIEGRERIVDGRVDTALERIFRTIGQLQA
jgi:flagellar biosynthesis/type III secretory pathway protein FliH